MKSLASNIPGLGSLAAMSAPSDWYKSQSNFIAPATGTPTQNQLYLGPYNAHPNGETVKGFGVGTTVALAGGTGVNFYAGLYEDEGSGQQPDFTKLLGSVIISLLTPAGNKYTALASPITLLGSKRYWTASLLTYTGAPTTQPTINCVGTAVQLPHNAGTTIGTAIKALIVASVTSLPTTNPQTVAIHAGSTSPVVGVRQN